MTPALETDDKGGGGVREWGLQAAEEGGEEERGEGTADRKREQCMESMTSTHTMDRCQAARPGIGGEDHV